MLRDTEWSEDKATAPVQAKMPGHQSARDGERCLQKGFMRISLILILLFVLPSNCKHLLSRECH